MNKKIYLKALITMSLIQFFWWCSYAIPNEILYRIYYEFRENYQILYAILDFSFYVVPIILIVLYFCFEKKLQKSLNINSLKSNVILTIGWVLITGLFYFIAFLIFGDYIGYCNLDLEGSSYLFGPCFLRGIEYIALIVVILGTICVIILLKLLRLVFHIIVKRFKKS